MNDYQLERLNTRSFEQLVQALSLQVLGPQVAVFGDGPDGGREATFDGTVHYPSAGKRWSGYGIVQAKFRQQPAAEARQNADWALAELKAEFDKLKPRPKRPRKTASDERACPDFYIFATNLALSPVLRKGGKDRVTAYLEDRKASHGLKGFAIWDGDQIRRLLDEYTGIRTSFLPFVLPGDVLHAVMHGLKPQRADFASIMLRHLQHELIDDQYARLGQGGYTSANRVSLSTVFVDLPTKGAMPNKSPSANDDEPSVRPTFLQGLFADAACVLRPSFHRPALRRGSGFMYGPVPGRCVVIGGPGQGKTTVGVFACQLMRAALLREAGGRYHPDVELAMAAIAEQALALPPLKTLRYPLRVDLKRLAEALAAPGTERCHTLMDFLVRHVARRNNARLEAEDFRLWLQNYPWLLVLDGLDEVPASSNRAVMMDALNDFIRVEAYQADADLMVVATTRPQGYSDEFDPSNYTHLHLLPLLPDEAVQYGSRLAAARHPGAQPHVAGLVRKLTLATKNPATARLMESPLQVTIMLSLIELGGHPPEKRWQLFHQYYETIFKREKERDTAFSVVLRDFESDIHWIHHRAGWLLQQRNAEPGKTAARLSHDEFDDLVHQRLVHRGHADDAKLADMVQQLREAATDRLVLLVGNTANEIGFEIRSLQEFMAAEHAFDGNEEVTRESLRVMAPHAYWRNAFLFAAGRIFFNKESLVDSVLAICNHLNEPLNDAALARTLAGSRLALAILDDDACRNQPANTRQLARLAARLMDIALGEERARLSAQFEREAGEVLRQELVRRLEGASFNAGAWAVCLDLARAHTDWAQELVRRCFPWGKPEADRLLWDYGVRGTGLGSFLWGEIALNLRHLSLSLVWILDGRGLEDAGPLKQHIDPGIAAAIAQLAEGSKRETVLLSQDGTRLQNRLRGQTDLSLYRLLRLSAENVTDAHVDWQRLAAADAFAGDPTLERLCLLIPAILSSDSKLQSHFALPWQFNACIDAARSGVAAEVIVERVRQGRLGLPRDWIRWNSLEECPIRALAHSAEVVAASNDALATVFGYAAWSHRSVGDQGELRFLEELAGILQTLAPHTHLTTGLIQLAGFGVLRCSDTLASNPQCASVILDFALRAKDAGHGLGRELTVAVLYASFPLETKIALLQSFASCALSDYWLLVPQGATLTMSEAWARLHAAAVGMGQERAVLAAMGQLPPMPCMDAVSSQVLEAMDGGSVVEQHAASLLRLSTRRWGVRDVRKMAATVVSLASSQAQWLSEWREYVDSEGLHGDQLESLFLALTEPVSHGAETHPEPHWARLLNKLVERRPAPTALPNPLRTV